MNFLIVGHARREGTARRPPLGHVDALRHRPRATQVARGLVRSPAMADRSFALTPGKRVLYLTKDPEKIRQQLAGTLTLTLDAVQPADLLDDIKPHAMTPAWVCFDYDPAAIANNAYAGLVVAGQRLIPTSALRDGNFE